MCCPSQPPGGICHKLRSNMNGRKAVNEEADCKNLPPKIRVEQHTFMGGLWFAAWLFTIGYLHLSFWKGVFALVVWPYFIGVHASTIMR